MNRYIDIGITIDVDRQIDRFNKSDMGMDGYGYRYMNRYIDISINIDVDRQIYRFNKSDMGMDMHTIIEREID